MVNTTEEKRINFAYWTKEGFVPLLKKGYVQFSVSIEVEVYAYNEITPYFIRWYNLQSGNSRHWTYVAEVHQSPLRNAPGSRYWEWAKGIHSTNISSIKSTINRRSYKVPPRVSGGGGGGNKQAQEN